jgi:TolA-binding protein
MLFLIIKFIVMDNSIDKVDEYFEIKNQIKTLRRDFKQFQEDHPNYVKLQDLNKKIKKLREEIRETEEIKNIKNKIDELKERQELLKELIRINLIESDQEEVKRNGKKLKLIPVLKEMPDKN